MDSDSCPIPGSPRTMTDSGKSAATGASRAPGEEAAGSHFLIPRTGVEVGWGLGGGYFILSQSCRPQRKGEWERPYRVSQPVREAPPLPDRLLGLSGS